MLAHRFLGLPRGQHRNSLEGNVGRRVVVTSKKTILQRDYRFYAAVLSEMDFVDADTREAYKFLSKEP